MEILFIEWEEVLAKYYLYKIYSNQLELGS